MKTKTPSVQQNVGNLSGGNQQKVLLSKWMFAEPNVLFLDEPSRGIDVGAKYEIYCIMNDMVKEGKAVVMISSELPELLGMCDRIYIMNEGNIVGEMDAKDATQEKIMSAILSSKDKGVPYEVCCQKIYNGTCTGCCIFIFTALTGGKLLLAQKYF